MTRPPYALAALAYAAVLTLGEFVLLAVSPPLFRSVLVADAAVGWLVVVASFQGLRALPSPPDFRWVAISSLAAGHWLAALVWLARLAT